MEFFTTDGDALRYTKTCRDFEHLGIDCCAICHEDPENDLDVVKVDGEPALLCCLLRLWFYPRGAPTSLSPEERLLRAIFGEHPYENLEGLDFGKKD